MPESQNGSLRTGLEISHFEIVEFDKEGSSSIGASDEACKHEIQKIFGTIGLTTAYLRYLKQCVD